MCALAYSDASTAHTDLAIRSDGISISAGSDGVSPRLEGYSSESVKVVAEQQKLSGSSWFRR